MLVPCTHKVAFCLQSSETLLQHGGISQRSAHPQARKTGLLGCNLPFFAFTQHSTVPFPKEGKCPPQRPHHRFSRMRNTNRCFCTVTHSANPTQHRHPQRVRPNNEAKEPYGNSQFYRILGIEDRIIL
jgi:hypothetical protein